jgi:predicted transcriptional regulator
MNKMSWDSDSYIKSGPGVTAFVGPDAMALMRATSLRSAIRLLQAGIVPARGFTLSRALKMAGEYTGKTYKRTQAEQARADLKIWCDEMNAALPHITEDRP